MKFILRLYLSFVSWRIRKVTRYFVEMNIRYDQESLVGSLLVAHLCKKDIERCQRAANRWSRQVAWVQHAVGSPITQ